MVVLGLLVPPASSLRSKPGQGQELLLDLKWVLGCQCSGHPLPDHRYGHQDVDSALISVIVSAHVQPPVSRCCCVPMATLGE